MGLFASKFYLFFLLFWLAVFNEIFFSRLSATYLTFPTGILLWFLLSHPSTSTFPSFSAVVVPWTDHTLRFDLLSSFYFLFSVCVKCFFHFSLPFLVVATSRLYGGWSLYLDFCTFLRWILSNDIILLLVNLIYCERFFFYLLPFCFIYLIFMHTLLFPLLWCVGLAVSSTQMTFSWCTSSAIRFNKNCNCLEFFVSFSIFHSGVDLSLANIWKIMRNFSSKAEALEKLLMRNGGEGESWAVGNCGRK